MTKKEIVKQISDRAELTQLKTKQIVQWTFDAIIETLLHEKRIELRNFGVFEVKLRKARKARNPRTSVRVDVEPKYVVTFQPGKAMEERVRELPMPAIAAVPSVPTPRVPIPSVPIPAVAEHHDSKESSTAAPAPPAKAAPVRRKAPSNAARSE